MKKFLLIFSIICFALSLVCGLFTGWIGAIVFTLLSVAGILIASFLLRNIANARWIPIIILIVLAIFLVKISICKCVMDNADTLAQNQITNCEKEEETDLNSQMVITDIEEEKQQESEETTKTENVKVVEKEVPVTVEKVVEKIVEKEVPVEKIVEKEVIVEKIVEVEKEVPVQTTTPNSNPTINFYGDPTVPNYGNGYGYNNGYYGDSYNNYGKITISGDDEVVMGESVAFTIKGVNTISESKLELPQYVSFDYSKGNKIYLIFKKVGWYEFEYGNATFGVTVVAE